MNKRIRTGALSAILAVGSIAGVVQIGGVVNAQVDDTAAAAQTDNSTDTTAPDGDRAADREARHAAREADRQALADLLGVDLEELRTQLESGSTLADIATANGVDVAAVVDLIVEQKSARIDQAVTDGRITAAEAAEKKTELATRVQTAVEEGGPFGRGGDGRHGGGRRGPGCDDDAAAAEAVPAETVEETPPTTDAGS